MLLDAITTNVNCQRQLNVNNVNANWGSDNAN